MQAPPPVQPSLIAALVHHYEALVAHVRSKRWCGQAGAGPSADEVAREAVHEVCLQLLREGPRPGEVRVPLAFLRTLTQRRAIDVLRRERAWRQPLVQADGSLQELNAAGAAGQPEVRLLAAQQYRHLVLAIEALPPRCRDAFVLCRIHGWSQQEAAQHLGMAVRTVERHVRVALACCRVALADVWGPQA